MPKCTIDGKEYEFNAGETVIQLADRIGVDIPRFCYHPGLSVVAQCRMCAVEVEKMPKMQTACSTPLADGMVVKTDTENVKKMQSSVMEFLLINHPLDCPICDKSGECDLQNYSFDYGAADSRYEEQRRTYMDLDMGPVIKKNMNRCIHCTRCIRFCDEVDGFREMVALKRGNNTEITTAEGRPLETEYAGNLADICPTGSLTLKEFRFKKRVWYLKKTPSVCEGCSKGCNIEVHHDAGVVYRVLPRENKEINKWWLCDEGRFNFAHVNSETRIVQPMKKQGDALASTTWSAALDEAKKHIGAESIVLVGSDLTNQEIAVAKNFFGKYGATIEHFGTLDVKSSKNDASEDKLLRRTSKTANLNGVESAGIKPYAGNASKYKSVILVTSGRAQIPDNLGKHIVGIGVFENDVAAKFDVVLPGTTYVEKDGTVVNYEGREQQYVKAFDPRGSSKQLSEIVGAWQ